MRISVLSRPDMDAEQGTFYDAAVEKKRPVGGPYYAYIRIPRLFEGAHTLRESLASGPLSRRETQIVNLTVARYMDAKYPWFAQVGGSLNAGIDHLTIDAINSREIPTLVNPREQMCFTVAREMIERRSLSDATYAAAARTMGERDLVALVAATGIFQMTCLTANAFAVDPPDENPVPLKE